jgi:hypothetical protein
VFALRKLDSIIDETWSEAAAKVKDIEELSDDAAFPQQELAARVASKVRGPCSGFSWMDRSRAA